MDYHLSPIRASCRLGQTRQRPSAGAQSTHNGVPEFFVVCIVIRCYELRYTFRLKGLVEQPMDGRARGIDVSHYNTAINWSNVAAAGVSFAFAKASQGADPTTDWYTD